MSKLYVVGLGPGKIEGITGSAKNAIEAADVIVGYTVYIGLIRPYYPEKSYLSTPMRKEVDRVRLALNTAAEGNTVAMVCSGDAGVYGMSGLCEELLSEYPGVEIETIPGVSAVLSGAAILGAPLMHDFAVISLSDLLTPWEKIEKRLLAAAEADFVICFYNPASHKRRDYLSKACDLVLHFASPKTVCGIAKNIGREGEETRVLTLGELKDAEVDMFSTVFIGNSETRVINGKMVTPRGYLYE